MKLPIISFLVLLSSLASFAQITLTSADLPIVGTTYLRKVDTNLVGFTVTAGSATAQVWNYATAFAVDYNDPQNYVAPSSLTGNTAFPMATVALNLPKDSVNAFLIGGASGLVIDGIYFYQSSVIFNGKAMDYSPTNQLIIPTPFTYGNTINNNSRGEFLTSYSGFPAKVVSVTNRTLTSDAFGSLTTPAGTFANTLRIKNKTYQYDSVYVKPLSAYVLAYSALDSSSTYTWLQNGAQSYLMEIETTAANTMVGATGIYNDIVTSVVNPTNTIAQVKTFPNPAQSVVMMDLSSLKEYRELVLLDITGKEIRRYDIGQIPAVTLDIRDLNNGVYFYQILGAHQNVLSVQKFVKSN